MPLFRRRRDEDPQAKAEVERITAALHGGPLAGRPVSAVPFADSDAFAVVVEIEGGEVRETWPAARAVLDTTGRWPLAVLSWDDEIDSSAFLEGDLAGDAISRARDRRAQDAVAAALRSAELSDDLHELDDVTEEEGEAVDHHLEWFDPGEQPTGIAFLPTASPAEAVAYVGFFGWEDEADELADLIAILRGWHERYGAEPVAAWGTMLQFVVERPPTDFDAAWALTVEHAALASDTLVIPGVAAKDHARALVGRREWFLHSRP